jgi:hypothetical protein
MKTSEKIVLFSFLIIIGLVFGWLWRDELNDRCKWEKDLDELEQKIEARNKQHRENYLKEVTRQEYARKLVLSKQYCEPKMITGSDHQPGKPHQKRTPKYSPEEWRIYFRNLRTGEEDAFRVSKALFDSLQVNDRIDTIKTFGLLRF